MAQKKSTSKKSLGLKKGSRVKLQHTDGEHLNAVVDHVQEDGLIEVTIDHKGHEKHGQKTVVRADGLVGGKAAKAKPRKSKATRQKKSAAEPAEASDGEADAGEGDEEENETTD